ncbi:MAG: DegT/DnrJ/EryC1/StrS family aminotransferase [bacterium]|nr:DegT/DnrJ/EryC1/StrS family aminotransferase [bacterium]
MIPLARPTLPKFSSIEKKLKGIFKSGMLTDSKYVGEFEQRCADFLGVENVAAVSSGTAALTLILKCLKLKGEVILPSFTFTSGVNALFWCGLTPVFADINPKTFNIDPASIQKKITKKTAAILATHVFGNPCEIEKIEKIAKKNNLKVIYDAAHAFGSTYKGKSVFCFGDASIVSFTPTKVITTAEGGLAVVKDKNFSRILKLGRNNGDSFNRAEEFLGITARMNEFSAILGIEGLKIFNINLKRRLRIINLYKKELAQVNGVSLQKLEHDSFSVYKDFTILVDEKKFGMSRDDLLQKLLKDKIQTKTYFYPPLHQKITCSKLRKSLLPETENISSRIMSLPLYSHMPEKYVQQVCTLIKKSYVKK